MRNPLVVALERGLTDLARELALRAIIDTGTVRRAAMHFGMYPSHFRDIARRLGLQNMLCERAPHPNQLRANRRYHDRLAAGLCTQCGAEPHVEKRILCQPCADRRKVARCTGGAEYK